MDIYHRVTVVQPGQRPDSYTELFADDRQFVGEGNVDVAEAVFGELAHLRRSGVRDNALALDEAAVEGDGRFGACRRQPADHAVVMDSFVQDLARANPPGAMRAGERRGGQECVSRCGYRGSPYH